MRTFIKTDILYLVFFTLGVFIQIDAVLRIIDLHGVIVVFRCHCIDSLRDLHTCHIIAGSKFIVCTFSFFRDFPSHILIMIIVCFIRIICLLIPHILKYTLNCISNCIFYIVLMFLIEITQNCNHDNCQNHYFQWSSPVCNIRSLHMLSPFFPGHIKLIHTVALFSVISFFMICLLVIYFPVICFPVRSVFFFLLMYMCKRHSVTITPVDPVILIRFAVIKPTFRTDSTIV